MSQMFRVEATEGYQGGQLNQIHQELLYSKQAPVKSTISMYVCVCLLVREDIRDKYELGKVLGSGSFGQARQHSRVPFVFGSLFATRLEAIHRF